MYKVEKIKINLEEYHMRSSKTGKRLVLENVISGKKINVSGKKYLSKLFLVTNINELVESTEYFKTYKEYKNMVN